MEEFNRIFLVSFLKASFMDVLQQIEEQSKGRDVKLSIKIENFQRNKMFDGLKKQRDGAVNAEALMKVEKTKDSGQESSGVLKGLEIPALINAPNGIKDGMKIMQQHIMNRDYKTSRQVINQLATWKDQQPGNFHKRQTIEEFANDPLGEKRKM